MTTKTRRTGNVRTRGRAALVVEGVLHATLQELTRVGYANLRVEDVAERAGVHKTTVYRRWPTKAELVGAAIRQLQLPPIDTGTVRGDLVASLLQVSDLSPLERGLARVVLAERTEPDLDALTRKLRKGFRRARMAMVERGVERGELPKGVDAALLVDLVTSPVQQALLFDERIRPRQIERIVDVALAGILADAGRRRR